MVSKETDTDLDTAHDSPRVQAAARLQRKTPSSALDRLADLAARLLAASASQLSLLSDVQVLAGSAGLPAGAAEGPSAVADSLCTVTAASNRLLLVTDATHDERVAHLPPVTSGAVGAYLGVPLIDDAGATVGALCVFGPQPRTWSDTDVATLGQLAAAAMAELELSALSGEHQTSQVVLDLAISAAQIGIFDLDLVAGTRSWDDRMLELHGSTREAFDPRLDAISDGVHPDGRAQLQAILNEASATGGLFTTEYRVQLAGGGTRWVSARGRALRDQSGTSVRLLGAAQDTTALREGETSTARILESMSVGFLAIDRQWRYTYINTEAERILGMARADLVGGTVWDLFPDAVGTPFEDNYRRAMDGGERVTFDAYYPAPLEAWLEVRVWPDADGLAVYFLDITARLVAQEAAETAARQRAADAEAMAGLVAIAHTLGEVTSEEEVLIVVAAQGGALLGSNGAGLCLRHLDGEHVRSLVTADYDGQVGALVQLLPQDFPLPAIHAAATGTAHFLSDRAATEARFPGSESIYAAVDVEASAAAPMHAHGRLLGCLSVGFPSARAWQRSDRDLVEALAALTAQALDRLAARDAERSVAAQQAALVAVARALGEASSETDVLAVVAEQGAQLLEANGSALALAEPGGTHLRILTTEGYDDDVRGQLSRVPVDFPLPAVRTAVTGTSFFHTDRATTTALHPGAEDLYTAGDVQASAAAPLSAHGRLLGCLSLSFSHARPWPQADRDLVEAFAAVTAQALERIASRQAERSASATVASFSETLQRSMLTSPPQPDHLQIAVRYSPAAAQAQVGGDWYDAFLTSSGATSLVIGDVTGHDQQAAAAMGQLRNLLRGIGYAIAEPPAAVLTILDRAAHDLAVGAMATLVVAQIEQGPDQQAAGVRRLRWSNAGHLPPLVITPEGTASYLEADPDLLLGLDPDTPRTDHEALLLPGSTVLLFTDGLVERRGAHLQTGLDWLAGAVAGLAHLPLEDLCDALLTQVGDRVEDDVALLAVRAHSEDRARPAEAGPRSDPLGQPTLPSDHSA